MMVSQAAPAAARALVGALLALAVLALPARAQPERGAPPLDHAGLRSLLTGLGYQPREVPNPAGPELEITLRPPGGLSVTTGVMLSKDGSLVWLVAWLKRVPPGRTISGNAVLDMLAQNDVIGPSHFSYNESRRWFFLNRPVPNHDLTPERLQAELAQLGATVARTEALWDFERWK